MKILNLVTLCVSLFFIACNNARNGNSSSATANISNYQIHTKLYFEYLRESDTKPVQVSDEQHFTFRNKADLEMLKRHFAVVTSYDPRESRPVGIGITNIWALAENEKTTRVDLNFFFKSKKIETGKTIKCTSEESSECSFDVSRAKFYMDISTKAVVCLLKIESEVELDFSGTEVRPAWRGISFPSSLDEDTLAGKPFAISVNCTADSKEIINGYFQHNSSIVPNL